jgi:hypothetical protein
MSHVLRGGTAVAAGGGWAMGMPRRTFSTAAWQSFQFPDQSRPTEPYTGLSMRPHASYNSDRNIAASTWRPHEHSVKLTWGRFFRPLYIRLYRSIRTRSDVFRSSGDEVDEAGAAVELREEDGGVALCVWAADPLQARPDGAVVAAPLPQHAAPVAAHPHPDESLITSSIQRSSPSHRLSGGSMAGKLGGRKKTSRERGMLVAGCEAMEEVRGYGVYKASGGGAVRFSQD